MNHHYLHQPQHLPGTLPLGLGYPQPLLKRSKRRKHKRKKKRSNFLPSLPYTLHPFQVPQLQQQYHQIFPIQHFTPAQIAHPVPTQFHRQNINCEREAVGVPMIPKPSSTVQEHIYPDNLQQGVCRVEDNSLPERKKLRKGKRKCSSASSIFKGVSWHKRDKCYMARVWVDGASKHIGSYQAEMRAAIAVDQRLKEMGRDVSYMNFASDLERDIALSILNNKNINTEAKDMSLEELKNNGLDRNGYPNTIISSLEGILKQQKEHELNMFSRGNEESSPSTQTGVLQTECFPLHLATI